MRAIAPNADLRPFQSSARSASSAATRTDRARAARATSRHRVDLGIHPALEAVELDEQHGGGIAGIAGADEVLDGARDLGVHHLERGGDDPGRDDPAHRRGGGVDRGEVEEQRRGSPAGRG